MNVQTSLLAKQLDNLIHSVNQLSKKRISETLVSDINLLNLSFFIKSDMAWVPPSFIKAFLANVLKELLKSAHTSL